MLARCFSKNWYPVAESAGMCVLVEKIFWGRGAFDGVLARWKVGGRMSMGMKMGTEMG